MSGPSGPKSGMSPIWPYWKFFASSLPSASPGRRFGTPCWTFASASASLTFWSYSGRTFRRVLLLEIAGVWPAVLVVPVHALARRQGVEARGDPGERVRGVQVALVQGSAPCWWTPVNCCDSASAWFFAVVSGGWAAGRVLGGGGGLAVLVVVRTSP